MGKFLFLGLAGILLSLNASADSAPQTVAMVALSGKPVRAGEIFTAADKVVLLIDRSNTRIELAPRAAAEFDDSGQMKLLRGSALVESRAERTLRTSSAQVEFSGRVLVSYDHKERSTSAFVFEGEARMVNPHQADRSLRLERLRGATLEVGGIFPQLIRDLNFAAVESWMKGYAWPEERSRELLKGLPQELSASAKPAATHLQETKLEDYFSSIETADEFSQPDYYEKKFSDPDEVVAEANSKKDGGRTISPEEAALIALPNTKIDLGFEILGFEQKAKEVAALRPPGSSEKKASRGLASVKPKPKAEPKALPPSDGLDPEVSEVLERLRGISAKPAVISQVPGNSSSRSPASVPTDVVPDPVYDFSENF